ncbi:BMP family lipoprotein [Maridesulfovibrio hydrothermalis]|uniref:Basic membrane lipoprotein n=1 Tax=Maridesulfovibrio hydrothermalis AM13 = DSM 14728 TaxID=1121451 RepID=L0RDP2_9BACT|nr:BMP family ABC transporter substrate-binding protein [Maridesulfovibrio hydrothermalis]CCO23686.1 Basic membrane lipoprotein [Maridesulfovibrio hydrothermalis AM13 = DSM 14728]
MLRVCLGKWLITVFVAMVIMCVAPEACFAKSFTVGFMASGTALDDDSFNGMTVAGLRKLQKEHDLKVEVHEGGFSSETILEGLNHLVERNSDIIVINTSTNYDVVLTFIKKHPELFFIINDIGVDGYPNVSSIVFGQRMGSYLVGALCGWQTATGKVGFIGGNENPVIMDFLCGFKQGLKASGRDIDLDVKFVRSGSSEKGFEDPRQANVLARCMYESGVDIIYAVAGLSGNGIIDAAAKTGNFVVGVDSDQDYMAKGTVLTSMMKRLDVAVYKEVLSVLNGEFVPGIKVYDLSNGGVGLTDMKYSRHLISEEILKNLKKLKDRLASGEIDLKCSDY